MNKFFKMSLLAASVAAAGAANAGTFDLTNAVYSAEGIELLSAAEQNAAADVVYHFDTDYEAGAMLTFTFSDGALAAGTVFAESILSVDVGDDTAVPIVTANDANVATFTRSSTTENSVTYKLTAKASGTVTLKNSTFTLVAAKPAVVAPAHMAALLLAEAPDAPAVEGLVLNTAAIKAGAVTVTASAEYQGVAFDPDTTTDGKDNEKKNQLASTATQFGKFALKDGTTGAEGVIYLKDGALGKVISDPAEVGGPTPLTDVFSLDYSEPAMPDYAVIGLKDDLDNDLTATKITTAYEVVAQLPGFKTSQITAADDETVAVTTKGLKVTLKDAAEPTGAVLTLAPLADKNDALVVQHFSVIPTIKYNDVVVTRPAVAAGNWTINAEAVNIPYMPYGASISQIIYATNSSAVDAQVSATAIDENGMSYALGIVGTANGNGAVTKLSGGVNAALAAQGFTKGKVSIDLLFAGVASVDDTAVKGDNAKIGESAVLTLPKGAIKVQSAYNVKGADRGFVANTTNGSN